MHMFWCMNILIDGFKTGYSLFGSLALLMILIFVMSLITLRILRPLEIKWTEKFCISIATAPLLYGILALFLSFLKIPFNPFIYLVPIVTVILLWRVSILHGFRSRLRSLPKLSPSALMIISTLFLISLIHLAWHRNLLVPSHIDSVQHARLTNVLIEKQTLPSSLPDAPDSGFVYHFGIHTLATATYFFGQGSLQVTDILLASGIILLLCWSVGMLVIFQYFNLNIWATIAGLCFMNFAFAMPIQLLNWGKYPVLLSFASFFPVVYVLITSIVSKRSSALIRSWIGIIIASMIIAHTRMLFIWMLIAVPIAIITFNHVRSFIRSILFLLPYLTGILFVTATWLLPAWTTWYTPGRTSDNYPEYLDVTINLQNDDFSAHQTTPALEASNTKPQFDLYRLKPTEIFWFTLIIFGLFVTGNEYFRIKVGILASIITMFVATIIPLPFVLGDYLLDASWLYSFIIIPFIVAFAILFRSLETNTTEFVTIVSSIVTIASLILGLATRGTYASNCCQLFTHDDMTAMEWIVDNTSESSHFGIASYQWEKGDVVGYDGGYWITVLTGRSTSVPSLFYGFSADVMQNTVNNYATTVDYAVRNGQDLCSLNLDYVYANALGGTFSPVSLYSHHQLSLVFINEGVKIFEVVNCD